MKVKNNYRVVVKDLGAGYTPASSRVIAETPYLMVAASIRDEWNEVHGCETRYAVSLPIEGSVMRSSPE